MRKTLLTALAFTLSLTAAQTARAWDPDPIRGEGNYTGVVRVLDLAFAGSEVYVAFSDDPTTFCLAQGSRVDGTLFGFGPAWLRLFSNDATHVTRWLSTLMWAKSQNVQVRVFLEAPRGNACAVTGFRTCSDAAACAYPPPAGP
jgi:hypothetical protein